MKVECLERRATSKSGAAATAGCPQCFHCSGGFAYLALLIAVAILGVVMAATGEVWHTAQTREKERELLFVGDQFRRAIGLFFRAGGAFPTTLEDLLKDPRFPGIQRYLRKIYIDPITGKQEWGLVKGPSGGIMGVYSLSKDKPLKTANFSYEDKAFEGASEYDKWIFLYRVVPSVRNPTPNQPIVTANQAGAAQAPNQPSTTTNQVNSAPIPNQPKATIKQVPIR